MASLYLCYKELLPATSIECGCFFVDGSGERYLVVCTASTLRIYAIRNALFQCLIATHIYGTPRDIAVFGVGQGQQQSLVMTLDEGKVVVFRFDPHTRSLVLLQPLNVETSAFGLGSDLIADAGSKVTSGGVQFTPFVTVDQISLMAATVVYGHQLLMTPLPGPAAFSKAPLKPFLVKDLHSLGIHGRILDIAFINGYSKPALAVLHDAGPPLPLGHLSKFTSNVCLSVLAVDGVLRKTCVLWRRKNLPHDSFRLKPLSIIAGAVIVISLNAVLVVDQQTAVGLAVNGMARHFVHKSIRLRSAASAGVAVGIELDRSRWVEIADGSSFLVTLKTGVLLHVRLLLPTEGTWTDLQFKADEVAMTTAASCLCCSGNLLFVGSRHADSLLLELTLQSVIVETTDTLTRNNASAFATPSASTKKPRRTKEDDTEQCSFAAEETLLYGAPLGSTTSQLSQKSFIITTTVLDALSALGPVLDGQFNLFGSGDDFVDLNDAVDWVGARRALADQSPLAYIAPREIKHALHVGTGLGEEAQVLRLSRGARMEKLAARNFPGSLRVASLVLADSVLAFVSLPQRTRVMKFEALADGGDSGLQEIHPTASPFVFADATIAVCMLQDDICAQVYATGIRLVNTSTGVPLADVIVEEDLDIGGLGGQEGETICQADVSAGHVVVLTSKGSIYILAYDSESEMLELKHTGSFGADSALGQCLSAAPVGVSLYFGVFNPVRAQPLDTSPRTVDSFDAEEMYLYGATLSSQSEGDVEGPAAKKSRVEASAVQPAEKTYCLVCDKDGGLSIIDVESMAVVFRTQSLSNGAQRIDVSEVLVPTTTSTNARALCRVQLGRISSLASNSSSMLCLVAVLETCDVLVYTAVEAESRGDIAWFQRHEHACITRKRSKKRSAAQHTDNEAPMHHGVPLYDYSISQVTSSSGEAFFVVNGPNPVKIGTHQGYPYVIPLGLPELPFANTGQYFIAPFSTASMDGIVSLWQEREESEGEVKVSKEAIVGLYSFVERQEVVSPMSALAMTGLKVGMTVHKCVEVMARSDDLKERSMLKQKTFLLVCSKEEPTPFLSHVINEEQFEEERASYERFFPEMESAFQSERDTGPPPPVLERRYKLVLVQGGAAVDVVDLKEGERVLDACTAYLQVDQNPDSYSSRKSSRVFIAASTFIADKHGEDSQGEGRLLFLSIDYALFQKSADVKTGDQSAEESQRGHQQTQTTQEHSAAQAKFLSTIQPKLKLAWEGPGPATVVKQLGGYLLSTVGPVVYMYKVNSAGTELAQISFFYAQFYITTVSVIKNYICVADACNSTQLLVWREEDFSLTLLATDFTEFGCHAAAYLLDDDRVALLAADDECNVKLLSYEPSARESNRLVSIADFHLGSSVSFMLSHRLLGAPAGVPGFMSRFSRQRSLSSQKIPFSTRLDKATSHRTSVVMGTSDGGIGIYIPVEERAYRRLALLQQILSTALETSLALNPRDFRVFRTSKVQPPSKKGVLDGTVLWRFVSLEASLQDELTASIGTTTDLVLENLHELDMLTAFF